MTYETPNTTTEYRSHLDACMGENPTRTLLIAAGVGLALAAMIRVLQPPPPSRGARLLEDLQDRLQELSERVTSLVNDRDKLVKRGADRVRDLGLDRGACAVSKRIRGLFS